MNENIILIDTIFILSTWTFIVISPGPNLLLTMEASLHASCRNGIFTALGFSAGTLIWLLFSLFGLTAFYHVFPGASQVIGFLAGGYFLYLAYKRIIESSDVKIDADKIKHNLMHSFLKGLIADLSNPKSFLFFVGIFSGFANIDGQLYMKSLVVFLIVLVTFLWYSAVSCLITYGNIKEIIFKSKNKFRIFSIIIFSVCGLYMWCRVLL